MMKNQNRKSEPQEPEQETELVGLARKKDPQSELNIGLESRARTQNQSTFHAKNKNQTKLKTGKAETLDP